MIDTRTMSLATAFVVLVFSVPFLTLASQRLPFRGLKEWAVSLFVGFLGLLLLGLRDLVPDVVSMTLGNTLVLAAYVAVLRGLRTFVGNRQQPWVDFGILLVAAIGFQVWCWPWPSMAARLAVLTGFTAICQALGVRILWRDFPRVIGDRPWVLILTFVAFMAWNLARAVLAMTLIRPPQNYMSPGLYQSLTFFPGMAWVILTGTSLLVATIGRVQRLADQEHHRLLADSQKRVERLSALNEISRAVSSELELQTLLETVHRQVARVLDASNFLLATVNAGADSWTMRFKMDRGERSPIETHPMQFGLTGYVLRSRKGLLFQTVQEKAAFIAAERIEAGWPEARSWMGVPLIAAETLVGAMAVQSYEREHLYTPDDLELFSTIASQIAFSIQNSRLYDELKQTLQDNRILHGLLPICAGCKKIRDDHGYWNQIETYLQTHAPVEFSHSLCPDCIRKYYPDLGDDVLKSR